MQRGIPSIIASLLIGLSPHTTHAWGTTTHRLINSAAAGQLPPSLSQLSAQQTFLVDHAADADTRKSQDPTESPKHFLDIDYYPDFTAMSGSYDSLVGIYTESVVTANGTVPWAAVWSLDSMTTRLRDGRFEQAWQSAADLGHYVGDINNALHCTQNYNGQLTGNTGIHSRYETTMMGQYLDSITLHSHSPSYINDPAGFLVRRVAEVNRYADSILAADNWAVSAGGWDRSANAPATYYTALWSRTAGFTQDHLQAAVDILIDLWYTAWVDAGLATGVKARSNGLGSSTGPAVSFSRTRDAIEIRLRMSSNFSDGTIRLTDLRGRRIAHEVRMDRCVDGRVSMVVPSCQSPLVVTIRADGMTAVSGLLPPVQ